MKKDKSLRAGSTSVIEKPKANDPTDKSSATKAIKAGDKEYKDPSELAKAYESLSKKYGEQSQEVGAMRGELKGLKDQNMVLTQQLGQNAVAADSATEEAPPDFSAQRAEFKKQRVDILKKVDEGDLDASAAGRALDELSAKEQMLTSQEVEHSLTTKFNTTLDERFGQLETENMVAQFNKEHPDFEHLRTDGTLDKYIQENPVLDYLSAYYAYHKDQEYERGKQDQAKLQEAETETEDVLTSPGTGVRDLTTNTKPLTDSEIKQKMMDTLSKQ